MLHLAISGFVIFSMPHLISDFITFAGVRFGRVTHVASQVRKWVAVVGAGLARPKVGAVVLGLCERRKRSSQGPSSKNDMELCFMSFAGLHCEGVSPIVVVGGSGDTLVVNSAPLSPWEPWAVEDADVNLTSALHKESSNKKSGLS